MPNILGPGRPRCRICELSRVDHEQSAVGQLDGHDLQRFPLRVLSEEDEPGVRHPLAPSGRGLLESDR
jgi:hypothetical protein